LRNSSKFCGIWDFKLPSSLSFLSIIRPFRLLGKYSVGRLIHSLFGQVNKWPPPASSTKENEWEALLVLCQWLN
jgi:hypothetical protein